MIRFGERTYTITTGNLVKNEKVDQLKDTLERINSYDKAGLKELFRKSLSEQNNSSDGTGNMGFIDMARKSGSKLIYQFEKLNDSYSYYTLSVKIGEKVD
jgi:hypothetical protein